MITIRMARAGRKNAPIFTIVAANSRSARDGAFLEKLGQYNPRSKNQELSGLKLEALQKWITDGAQISDTVKTVLRKNNVKL